MELDDLKSAWKSLDQRLAQQNAISFEILKIEKVKRARSALRPLMLGQVILIVIGLVMCGMFAPFWITYKNVPHLLVCGLLLHAYAILFIVAGARGLLLIWNIDFGAPVLTIQRQLAALHAWQMRMGPIFAVTGCFIWIPLLLIFFRWLGVDVWVEKPTVVFWFLVNAFICLAVTVAILWWSRRGSADRMARMEDQVAGCSVRRAKAAIEEIVKFEQQ